MIRIGILALVIVMLGGCVSMNADPATSSSLYAMKETCRKDRSKVIRAEWRNFEFRNWAKIWQPNWRVESDKWAKRECEYGRNIKGYHPHYIKGSILRR